MNSSDQTYKQYSFADHKEVYGILETVFHKKKIKYYLIGANARDVQMYKVGVKPNRGTADIDFAIMVPDIEVYDSVFNELCDLGFRRTRENYRLFYEKTNTAIDLMPYGEIEQDYTVNFTERDLTLSVLGFNEVGSEMELVRIVEEGYDLNVSPVEGLLILKLVSWSENPEARTKDLDDISALLNIVWEFYEEEAYEHHQDLFDGSDFNVNHIAARILGRKMRVILKKNDVLNRTIISILEKSIEKKTKPVNPELNLAQNMDKSIEDIQKLLTIILLGIND